MCKNKRIWITLLKRGKLIRFTKEVDIESIIKCLIGNQFHVTLIILSPEINSNRTNLMTVLQAPVSCSWTFKRERNIWWTHRFFTRSIAYILQMSFSTTCNDIPFWRPKRICYIVF